MFHRWLLLAATASFVAAPASATTYNVSIAGSDSSNGVSAPFRTFQKAAGVLASGDTILLQPGSYTACAWLESLNNVTIQGAGTSASQVILDGTGGSRVDGVDFYACTNITLKNVTFQNCQRNGIFVVLSDFLTIENCTTTSNANTGILTGNTSDVLIQNCVSSNNPGQHGIYCSQSGDRLRIISNTMYGNGRTGLQINADQPDIVPSDPNNDGISVDCLVDGNTIYGNNQEGGGAIALSGVQSSTIVNNLIYNSPSGGITLFDDDAGPTEACKNNQILCNTIVFASGVGIYGLQFVAGSTGNQVYDNIVICGKGPDIDTVEPITSDYNCYYGSTVAGGTLASWQSSTGQDHHSIWANPDFVNGYHLPVGSPCRDTGSLVYPTDMLGTQRPQGPAPDMGCYEEPDNGTVSAPPPTQVPAAGAIYEGALVNGWTSSMKGATCNLAAARPAFSGGNSIALTITGDNGYLSLSNSAGATGMSTLTFSVNGGVAGDQELRVRAVVNGTQQESVSLWVWAKPQANGWVTYTVPLSALNAAAGTITAIRFMAGHPQKAAYLAGIALQ